MRIYVLLIFIVLYSFLSGIDVSGSIYEDTVWSPENNPYHVVSDITVEEGAKLTIEPGVLVLMKSMLMYDHDNFLSNADYNSIDHTGNIFVYGELETIGTETDSIRFTRDTDSLYYHWGIIRIYNQESRTEFRHCHIDHSSAIFTICFRFDGAITSNSSVIIVENCYFFNDYANICAEGEIPDRRVFVQHSRFLTELGEIGDYWGNHGGGYSLNLGEGVYFDNYIESKRNSIYGIIAYNKFSERYCLSTGGCPGYIYRNDFGRTMCTDGGMREIYFGEDGGVLADNKLENMGDINIEASNEIYVFNNRFITTDLNVVNNTSWSGSETIFNNYFEDSMVICHGGYSYIYNNISINTESCGIIPRRSGRFHNNVFINNDYILDTFTNEFVFEGAYENCIFLDCSESLSTNPDDPLFPPGFRNCLMDLEFPITMIDLGDNIIDESLDAEDIFIDPSGGDFRLQDGSVCIDAGYEDDLFPSFDGDYHARFWDGDGNGTSEIDIGVFEYGSPAFGGIEGYTYDLETDEILKFTFVHDPDEIINFDISDSNGYYKITLADGVYDLKVEFPFYQDIVMEGITVNNGEFTGLDLYLAPEDYVDTEEDIVKPGNGLLLYNYPNPFNPETTIAFSAWENAEVTKAHIYNVKGQCVRKLKIENLIHQVGQECKINWDGKDDKGKYVSSGIYFCKLKYGDEEASCKMMLLK